VRFTPPPDSQGASGFGTSTQKAIGMDEADKRILNEIQSSFPINSRPYLEVARRINLSEKEVIERVRRLKREGIIRRIGGNFQSKRLNFTSTLCAAKVPEEKIEEFVQAVNRYSGVTHNYRRSHAYNIWFTFIAQDMDEIERSLREISLETGVKEIRNLPSQRMFKIKVDFEV
jgi:DNA-binding Lrp family transcriptional regulator